MRFLKAFRDEFNSAFDTSTVEASIVKTDEGDRYVQVYWTANPSNYSTQVGEIRDGYPEISAVDAPEGFDAESYDSLPIQYFSVES